MRIDPGPRHHARAVARANLVFVGIDQGIEGVAIDQSLFDQQRFKRLHAQRGVRRDRLLRVTMVLASTLGVDRGGRCPCGRHSGLQETASAFVHRILLPTPRPKCSAGFAFPLSLREHATPRTRQLRGVILSGLFVQKGEFVWSTRNSLAWTRILRCNAAGSNRPCASGIPRHIATDEEKSRLDPATAQIRSRGHMGGARRLPKSKRLRLACSRKSWCRRRRFAVVSRLFVGVCVLQELRVVERPSHELKADRHPVWCEAGRHSDSREGHD